MHETVFNKVDYTLGHLLHAIAIGQLALPDLQRPFVWKNAKVRDLFDSLYRGYPVGYLLFWQSFGDSGAKSIGTDKKQVRPDLLVVDGQQRLTALYAVTQGIPVIREDFSEELIEIAFSPLDGTFEVADAATRNDPRYIASISALWKDGASLFTIAGDYLTRLRTSREQVGEVVSDGETAIIQNALQRLANLTSFPFTALVLSQNVTEEQVAEVFVRINSKGKSLNQADFILTLMSVFWDDGRKALEAFSRNALLPSKSGATPFNNFIEPKPDQLLRVAVGVAFRRARLQHVYSLLRGKDLSTGEFSAESRDMQFGRLMEAQRKVLDIQNWHDFLSILPVAGYRGGREISSGNAVLMAYILFLIGRTELAVDGFALKRAVARWFFMTSLTGRYTAGAPETAMERDLGALRSVATDRELLDWIDSNIAVELTSDFWSITLPNRLKTSAARSPALFGYYAALVILDAKVLFSHKAVADLLDPVHKAKRRGVERHHLFPKKFLKKEFGLTSVKEVNQIANQALVEWDDNAQIAAGDPRVYVPIYNDRFKGKQLAEMYYWHALPQDWHSMDYGAFLEVRRHLMAKVVKDGFYRLGATGHEGDRPSLAELLAAGEGLKVEYKSTLRINLHTGQPDSKIELAALKTIAAFLNTGGGSLVIGADDSGTVIGTAGDGFDSDDKLALHLDNIVRGRIGDHVAPFLEVEWADVGHQRAVIVRCPPATQPVYVKDGPSERFYVRAAASTSELVGSHAQHYIDSRF